MPPSKSEPRSELDVVPPAGVAGRNERHVRQDGASTATSGVNDRELRVSPRYALCYICFRGEGCACWHTTHCRPSAHLHCVRYLRAVLFGLAARPVDSFAFHQQSSGPVLMRFGFDAVMRKARFHAWNMVRL